MKIFLYLNDFFSTERKIFYYEIFFLLNNKECGQKSQFYVRNTLKSPLLAVILRLMKFIIIIINIIMNIIIRRTTGLGQGTARSNGTHWCTFGPQRVQYTRGIIISWSRQVTYFIPSQVQGVIRLTPLPPLWFVLLDLVIELYNN